MVEDTSTGMRVKAAALRLFASRGFEGTGIRQIAEEAGISVASLYHYMGTKEDLLDRMMRDSMLQLLGPAAQILAQDADPATHIAELVELHVRRHAEQNLLCVVADTEIRSLSPVRRREMVALRDEYEDMWVGVIDRGVKAGVFQIPDAKVAAMALIVMCTGVAYWYVPGGRLPLDQICKIFVTMALNLLNGGGLDAVPASAVS